MGKYYNYTIGKLVNFNTFFYDNTYYIINFASDNILKCGGNTQNAASIFMNQDNNFSLEIKECDYKCEHYSVRDDGMIFRHRREGKPKRKLDEVWTFGIPNIDTGYMIFCGERVHRIVATAFHGQAPSDQHVVDHIDTNRQNNRPENLRWLTKLENILRNEITRKKIEFICGSVEAFLENPQLLSGFESVDKNFSWMRNVTKEEAQYCLDHWSHWAETAKPDPNNKRRERNVGEWIYSKPLQQKENNSFIDDFLNRVSSPDFMMSQKSLHVPQEEKPDRTDEDKVNNEEVHLKIQSLTPNAIQIDWKNPEEFPCCPQQATDNPLEAYLNNLEEGKVFCKNLWGESTILRFGMTDINTLWVMCSISIGWNTHAITKITYEDGIYYHENMGVFDIGDEPEELFESILRAER